MTDNQLILDRSVKEKLFTLLVNSVKEYAIFLIDKNGCVLSWNKGAERIKGYTEEEIKGKNISIFYTPEDQQKGMPAHVISETLKKGVHETEGWRVRKDGSRFWADVVLTALYDDDGKFVGIAKMTRDITEQKKFLERQESLNHELEQKVKANTARILAGELRFKKLIEYSSDGIILLDEHMNIVYRSLSAEQITGWTWSDLKETRATNLAHPDDRDRVKGVLKSVLEQPRVPIKCTFRSLHKNGNYVWLEIVYTNHLEAPGVHGIVCNFRDVTEIKDINETLEKRVHERTLQLEEANRELEAFSYSVSHDLRTPLRAINGYANMLKEDFGELLDTEGSRILNTISHNAHLMGTLIDDLLSFSRLGRKEIVKTQTDMKMLVNNCVRELNSDTKRYTVTVHDLPPCDADSGMMKQVWLNLIGNALKYSSKKEHAEIEIGATEDQNTDGEKYYTYHIKDNGVGFDMQYSNKLFGVFQRLHRLDEFEGTGVGLALVKRIINRHGGRIWAEGEPNKGATFYFTLPITH